MQTGIISFGDRVAWNIKCNNTKDMILNEIYNLYGIRIIQKHYFKLDETNIHHLNKEGSNKPLPKIIRGFS